MTREYPVCGLRPTVMKVAARLCLLTQVLFPVMAGAGRGGHPSLQEAPRNALPSLSDPHDIFRTVPHTLGPLESVQSVAARYGITVDELRRLNQFRTFSRGFDHIRQGDEIDIPPVSRSDKPAGLQTLLAEGETASTDPEVRIARVASQAGGMLQQGLSTDQVGEMARGYATGTASSALQEWLSQWGTARVTLGTDENFTLKGSALDLLLPWYDTPADLLFTQHSIHRTDDRSQLNTGMGWRHFTPVYMTGVNLFHDYDLTRYHSRLGLGAEFWRDYLKFGTNGYLRLSNWRSAPELDHDYDARPANGWDLRMEAWLPAWPQLGGKLVFEQYYGDEVALFGRHKRQKDPHAFTAGLSYTPVPLLSLSAEQRQGKAGENDTRFGLNLTYTPGVSLSRQLDPEAVAPRRSLAGSRQDLVERNNNIVLEYRRKELVKLTLTNPVTGKSGEVKTLVSSLQSKYAVKQMMVEAGPLTAAGGSFRPEGSQVAVTLPAYRYTASPETDNSYQVAVTAEDVKGNRSARVGTTVVVQKPVANLAFSTVTTDREQLKADGQETAVLTFTARDSTGSPVRGLQVTSHADLPAGMTISLSETFTETGTPGIYTAELRGTTPGSVSVMPQVGGKDAAKEAVYVTLASRVPVAEHSGISLHPNAGHVFRAGEAVQVTVILKDSRREPMTGGCDILDTTTVTVPGMVPSGDERWSEQEDGSCTKTYTAKTAGDNRRAVLQLSHWADGVESEMWSIQAGDIAPGRSTVTVAPAVILADGHTLATVTYTARDAHDNAVSGLEVTLGVTGEKPETDTTFTGFTEDTRTAGTYTGTLSGTQTGVFVLMPRVNGSDAADVGGMLTLTENQPVQDKSSITTDSPTYTAGNIMTLTVKLVNEQGQPFTGLAASLEEAVVVPGAMLKDSWTETSAPGTYRATYTAKTAGVNRQATVKLSGWSGSQTSGDYDIIAGEVDGGLSALHVDKGFIVADGDDFATMTLVLVDSYGNPVSVDSSDVIIINTPEQPGLSITEPDNGQKAEGIYIVTVRGTVAGWASLQVTVAGSDVMYPITLILTEHKPVQNKSTIDTNKHLYAVGEDMMVTVKLMDEKDKPVTGLASSLGEMVTVPGAALLDGWTETSPTGTYSATYTVLSFLSGLFLSA